MEAGAKAAHYHSGAQDVRRCTAVPSRVSSCRGAHPSWVSACHTISVGCPHDQPRTLSSELIAELRRIQYLREAAIELAEDIPQQPGRFVGTCRLRQPPAQVARRALELLGVGPPPHVGWRTAYDALNGWKNAIEEQGVLVMHLSRVELREVRGIAIAEGTFPLIAVNGKDPPYGRVFTLIHEFVHLMLGATGISTCAYRTVRAPLSSESSSSVMRSQVRYLSARGNTLTPVCPARTPRLDWPDETINDLSDFFRVSVKSS